MHAEPTPPFAEQERESLGREADPLLDGRNETPLERCDRNLVELLQEVRVVQTGVQVLFAFLLIAPLSARFAELTWGPAIGVLRGLVAAGAAALLLMAPTAYHRILFRCGDKGYLVRIANRFTLAGVACVGSAMLGSLLFVSDLLLPGVVAVVTVSGSCAGGASPRCGVDVCGKPRSTNESRPAASSTSPGLR